MNFAHLSSYMKMSGLPLVRKQHHGLVLLYFRILFIKFAFIPKAFFVAKFEFECHHNYVLVFVL